MLLVTFAGFAPEAPELLDAARWKSISRKMQRNQSWAEDWLVVTDPVILNLSRVISNDNLGAVHPKPLGMRSPAALMSRSARVQLLEAQNKHRDIREPGRDM